MSLLQPSTAVEIGGKMFTISKLPFKEQRVLLPLVSRILGAFDPTLGSAGSIIMALLADQVSDKDLDMLISAFGKATSVDFQDGVGDRPSRLVKLSNDSGLDAAFGGDISEIYEWLDAAIRFHFEEAISKMQRVIQVATDARRITKSQDLPE